MPEEAMMSHVEIARIAGARKDSVKRTVIRLAEKGLIILTPTVEVSQNRKGPKTETIYNVNRRSSYIVMAQISPEFCADLVDRWIELEGRGVEADYFAPLIKNDEWYAYRDSGRALRRDDWQSAFGYFFRYAHEWGCKDLDKFYYGVQTKKCYYALFHIPQGAVLKKVRDILPSFDLSLIQIAESRTVQIIRKGMAAKKHPAIIQAEVEQVYKTAVEFMGGKRKPDLSSLQATLQISCS